MRKIIPVTLLALASQGIHAGSLDVHGEIKINGSTVIDASGTWVGSSATLSPDSYNTADYRWNSGVGASKIFSRTTTKRNTDGSGPLYTIDSCDHTVFTKTGVDTRTYENKVSETGNNCGGAQERFSTLNGARYFLGWDRFSGNEQSEIATFQSPFLLTPSSLTVGQSWVAAEVLTTERLSPPGPYAETYDQVWIVDYRLVGIEDVTVSAGTFQGCLKIYEDRAVPGMRETRIVWHCPDMGMVKRIRTFVIENSDQRRSEVFELESYQ